MTNSHKIIDTGAGFVEWDDPSLSLISNIWMSHELVTESGGLVTAWEDSKGGLVLSNTGGTQRPTLALNQVNNLPSIQFDGVSNTLNLVSGTTAPNGEFYFLVFNFKNTVSEEHYVFTGGYTTPDDKFVSHEYTLPPGDSYGYRHYTGIQESQAVTLAAGPHSVFGGVPDYADTFMKVDGTEKALVGGGTSPFVSEQIAINSVLFGSSVPIITYEGDILAVIRGSGASDLIELRSTIQIVENNLSSLYGIDYS